MANNQYDAIIIGGGAAGLMCAIEAGKRNRRVLVLDHAKKPAEKIRISGGGRCNFTNIHATPKQYISSNPKFCISAMRRYTPADFVALVEKHHIAYHEKTLGQLFCDESATLIIHMLLDEMDAAGATLMLHTAINDIAYDASGLYHVATDAANYTATSLVVACGGKSIPKMGATGFGYDIATKFGMSIMPTSAALVPFTLEGDSMAWVKSLSGLSFDAQASCGRVCFDEAVLLTHRGLSGPAMLQLSSYWTPGQEITINMAPHSHLDDTLQLAIKRSPKQKPLSVVATLLPNRLAAQLCADHLYDVNLAELPKHARQALHNAVHCWTLKPAGTEGYRTAEVTRGGVDTAGLSSRTMESLTQKGLYFIGEVVDVTGHLGGYNFQWAWASGYAAGQYV